MPDFGQESVFVSSVDHMDTEESLDKRFVVEDRFGTYTKGAQTIVRRAQTSSSATIGSIETMSLGDL